MICIYCGKEALLEDIVPADFIAIAANGFEKPQYSVHRRCDRPLIETVTDTRNPYVTLDDLDAMRYSVDEVKDDAES